MRPRARLFALAFLALSTSATSVGAQSLKDRVRGHVDENLDEPKKKKKKPKKKRSKPKKRHPSSKPRPAPSRGSSWVRSAPDSEPPERGPKLPKRILGSQLQIDPQVGGGYRGWRSQQFPGIDVDTTSYTTFSIGASATLFKVLSINRAYFESTGVSAPARSGAVIAQRAGVAPKAAAWLLAAVGVPLDFIWEPMIRYESRAFETEARPTRPVRIVPHEADEDADPAVAFPLTTAPLTLVSRYETLVVAAKYKPSKDSTGMIGDNLRGSLPPLYIGLGAIAYGKPYQLTVGDAVLDELVFDARFRGAGAAFGFETVKKADRFYGMLDGQVGLGEVKLTRNLTLNEVLPEDWLIGYVQGNGSVGYLWAPFTWMPTPLLGVEGSVGGATFFYFKTVSDEGEERTPPLNWDLLWSLRAYLLVPL